MQFEGLCIMFGFLNLILGIDFISNLNFHNELYFCIFVYYVMFNQNYLL